MEEETETGNIMFGTTKLKRDTVVTYLGDQLHEGGLADSVEATINTRVGKVQGPPHADCRRG